MIRLYIITLVLLFGTACTLNVQIEATSAAQQGGGTLTESLAEEETTETSAELDAKVGDKPIGTVL